MEITHAKQNAKAWLESIVEMVSRLNAEESDAEDNTPDQIREAAEQEIQESPLSVEVRDGWRSPGEREENNSPEEYRILLSTGGPALRIIGELDQYSQPEDARLQWQDWGTPWTDYDTSEHDAALLTFAQQFYFGE